MKRRFQTTVCVVLVFGCLVSSLPAQDASDIESPKHKAWDLLQTAIASKRTVERTDGVRALGLLRGDARAQKLAEDALEDRKPEVRAAAATALGQMHAMASIPRLQ